MRLVVRDFPDEALIKLRLLSQAMGKNGKPLPYRLLLPLVIDAYRRLGQPERRGDDRTTKATPTCL